MVFGVPPQFLAANEFEPFERLGQLVQCARYEENRTLLIVEIHKRLCRFANYSTEFFRTISHIDPVSAFLDQECSISESQHRQNPSGAKPGRPNAGRIVIKISFNSRIYRKSSGLSAGDFGLCGKLPTRLVNFIYGSGAKITPALMKSGNVDVLALIWFEPSGRHFEKRASPAASTSQHFKLGRQEPCLGHGRRRSRPGDAGGRHRSA
jgi:hypothetical protein